ncbi:MAG: hypothetical protein ACFFCW_21745 [Candidatus Hodarchaeota archaeon]
MIEEIEWGASISDLPDMVLMEVVGSGKRVYTREGEKLKIGDVDVERIMYGFYKDRLYEVQIRFRRSSSFAKLKEKLFRVYGPGRQRRRSLETYQWYGNNTSVFLGYDEKSEKGVIDYTFVPIYRERQRMKVNLEEYNRRVEKFKMVRKYVSQ